jgi:hypothetical protein
MITEETIKDVTLGISSSQETESKHNERETGDTNKTNKKETQDIENINLQELLLIQKYSMDFLSFYILIKLINVNIRIIMNIKK